MKFFKKIIYFLICLIVFLEITVYFLPKKQLFLLANAKLSSYLISLDAKDISDRDFRLILKNSVLTYDKMQVASSKKIEFLSLIFFEKITIRDIKLSDIVMGMLPKDIKEVDIKWTPLYGYKVRFHAIGDVGKIDGYVDLFHKKVVLHLNPSRLVRRSYRRLLRQMKKEGKGYKYVKNF